MFYYITKIIMGFWKDFGKGFQKGFGTTLQVGGSLVPIPGVSAMGKEITKLHKGGKVPKTGNYRLKGGEVVLNKTQQSQLRKVKTAKTKQKIISNVKKRHPKKMDGRRK